MFRSDTPGGPLSDFESNISQTHVPYRLYRIDVNNNILKYIIMIIMIIPC